MTKRFFIITLLMLPLSMAAQRRVSATRYEVSARLDSQRNPRMDSVLAPYKNSVDSIMAPVLGESLTGMSAARPESLLGNWVADALVWGAKADSLGAVDFGLVNVGGLRNNMPKGTVRRGDILLISPFQNFLTLVALKGNDVMALMQNIASVGGEAVSREVRLECKKDGTVSKATIGGNDIEPDHIYHIATIDYLAEGNDKMTAMKRATATVRTKTLANEVMMRCIRAHQTIDAHLEGRIIIKQH